ncbi:MAG: PEP-CTERM sorting domain-containing protein [Pseudomonadota bacterium]
MADLNTKSITLRFGTDWNVGLREVRYETSIDDDDGGGDGDPSAVPVPAALPLLASGLGGFWLIRLRRRNEGVVG